MNTGVYQAVSSAVASQLNVDLLSNNLANVNTAGYKRDKGSFVSVLADTVANAAANEPRGDYPSLIDVRSRTDFGQGVLRETGNPLDLALEGKGFFAVQGADSTLYSRGGGFTVDPNGTLVTGTGQPLLANGAPMVLPAGRPTVGADGTVTVDGVMVGKLDLVDFKEGDLAKEGDSFYRAKAGAVRQEARVAVRSGSIESSNVNAVEEMVRLMEANRSYDAAVKVIQSFDELSAKSADLGKL